MLTLLAYYVLFNVTLHILMVFVWGRAHFTKNNDPELKKKYAPFCRTDMHLINSLHTVPGILTSTPRIVIGISLLVIYAAWAWIVSIGVKPENLGPTRLFLIRKMGEFACRGILLMVGIVWIQKEYVTDADYKKWLGPDWTPKWEGAGTLV